jgi:hypothetical protein
VKVWIALLAVAGVLPAQVPEVEFRLNTAGGKTSFRLGEPIALELAFTSTVAGKYSAIGGGTDRMGFEAFHETFEVAPSGGTADPLADYFKGGMAANGLAWNRELSPKPVAVEHDLNQWVRFARPGHYRIRATSHRVSVERKAIELKSNQIEIDLIDDPDWIAAQVAEAERVLRTVPKSGDSQVFNRRMAAARQLWYADTPESVRASARLLDGSDVQAEQILRLGLFASSRRPLVVQTMRQLLDDPAHPVAQLFLNTLASLENAKPESLRPQLADALGRKQGAAKAASLRTLIRAAETADSVPASQRTAMAAAFPDLPAEEQAAVLGYEWSRIASPAMLPVVRKIVDTGSGPVAASALARLYELDPAQGRTLILADMARSSPRFPLSTLSLLPDATLPDLDAAWLSNLPRESPHAIEELVARYATASILEGVKAFYAGRACEPPLIAYFLRVDPPYGEKLLRAAMADRGNPTRGCWATAIGRTAAYFVNAQWESVALDALNDATVVVKIDAVKALGRYGTPESKSRLFDSFRYFHDWWKDKPSQINDENRWLESAYVQTIGEPANWIATADDLSRASAFCITDGCRGQMEQNQRFWSKPLEVSAGRSSDGSYYVSVAQFNARSLEEARKRLLQLPKGTGLHWQLNGWPDDRLTQWAAQMKSELEAK